MKDFSFDVVGNLVDRSGAVVGEVITGANGQCSDACKTYDIYNQAVVHVQMEVMSDVSLVGLHLTNIQVTSVFLGCKGGVK